MDPKTSNIKETTRRQFLRDGIRVTGLTGLGFLGGALLQKTVGDETVWQIDPARCLRCGRCATECVLEQSAVRCVHAHAICGYCELCTGYFEPEPNALNTAAENQLCPTAAIRRSYVEDPYFEYVIDEELCIGCARCVEGCNRFGNGSLHLQVMQNLCVRCNECAISRVCPGEAFRRLDPDHPYVQKEIAH